MQFEYWLESGFASILSGLTTAPVYDTATRAEVAVSPRIECKAIVGPYVEHRYKFTNGYVQNQGGTPTQIPFTTFDAYQGSLEVTVITNRQDNTATGDHRRLLGLTRARMLLPYVWQNWNGVVIIPQDIRPAGTADTFIDENDLDVTVMVHDVLFHVVPSAWPATI